MFDSLDRRPHAPMIFSLPRRFFQAQLEETSHAAEAARIGVQQRGAPDLLHIYVLLFFSHCYVPISPHTLPPLFSSPSPSLSLSSGLASAEAGAAAASGDNAELLSLYQSVCDERAALIAGELVVSLPSQ